MALLEYINEGVNKIIPYEPGRPIAEVAREFGLNLDHVVKIASNESPFGTSPLALEAIRKCADKMNLYPDGGAYYLKRKLAEKFNILPEHIVIGNGSNELLEFIAHCFLSKDTSMVMSKHAFVIYKLLGVMFESKVIEVPMKEGLTHDLDAMLAAIKEDTRVVFICNPNNPTGSMVENSAITEFMKKVPNDVLVVFDEAYAEICQQEMPNTLSYVKEGRNVIVLRSFSKAYGLAGLRVGYGITTPELAKVFNKPRQPFNCNRMAQIAATAALDDEEFIIRSKKKYGIGIKYLTAEFDKMNVEYISPNANFILIKVGNGADIFQELQKKGVIVRPMAAYMLPEWVRVSIGTKRDNEKFISTLTEIMKR
jgi:histidinol-phosphate aminotransferase